MIEGLLATLFGVALLCALVVALIALPFVLLGFLFKALFFLVMLPFRILFALLGALVGVGLFILKGFLFVVAAVGGLLLLLVRAPVVVHREIQGRHAHSRALALAQAWAR